jgi:translation initiation factor 2 subunit 3
MKHMVAGEGQDASQIMPLRSNEMLMVNVATATSVGVVSNSGKGKATLTLKLPICADSGQRISLSRRVGSRWRLIGHGTIE